MDDLSSRIYDDLQMEIKRLPVKGWLSRRRRIRALKRALRISLGAETTGDRVATMVGRIIGGAIK